MLIISLILIPQGKIVFGLEKSGAYQTLIFNDHRSALITENVKDTFNVDEVITQISSDTDIILIEGLKNMNFPKIEVHRKEISKEILFKKDSNHHSFHIRSFNRYKNSIF